MIGVKAVNHIGIAVKSIAEHRGFYEQTLGARFDGIEEVPAQKLRVAFFVVGAPGHEMRIELLEPTSPDATVAGFIEKRGEGLHHIAYGVDGLDGVLGQLEADGIRLIDRTAREGAHHHRIAFLHPKSCGGVLTELCEPSALGSKG